MIPTRVPRLRTFAVLGRYRPYGVTASYAVKSTTAPAKSKTASVKGTASAKSKTASVKSTKASAKSTTASAESTTASAESTTASAKSTAASAKSATNPKKNLLLKAELGAVTPTAQKLLDTGAWKLNKRSKAEKDAEKEDEDAGKPKRATRKTAGPKIDKARVNIVSDELCDDIISYIGPSLDRHKGCDLLDMYPGVGLWSKALNDYLQPRSHIMMEPNADFYKPFLKDILDRPGSRIVPLSGIVWKELNSVLNPEFLPHQKPAPQSHRNDTLLVTANIALHPKRRFMGFESIARLVQHQFVTAIRSSQIFQRYGQVRMLLWTRCDDKTSIVVRSLQRRQRSALEIELLCEYIHEVAGRSGPDSVWYIRDTYADRYSAQLTAQRMRDNGIVMPERRMPQEHKDALDDLDKGNLVIPGAQPPEFARPYQSKLAGMQEENEAKEFEMGSEERRLLKQFNWRETSEHVRYQDMFERQLAYDEIAEYRAAAMKEEDMVPGVAREPVVRRVPRLAKTAADPAARRARGQLGKEAKAAKDAEDARKAEELVEAKETFKKLQNSNEPVEVLDEAEIRRLEKEWDDGFSRLPHNRRLDFTKTSDNLHLVRQTPPAMNWDRRQFEPLEITELDFLPNIELSLLDIQPKTVHPMLTRVGPNSDRAADVFDLVMRALLMSRGKSLRKMLDSIWPGAADWIIPRCKSLRDPAVGGKPVQTEYASISPRVMNAQQWLELLECWMEWPFRPTYLELLARSQDDSIAGDDRKELEDA